MVNTELLEKEISASGRKKGYLARKCGISRQSFLQKCRNQSEFTAGQVMTICDELNISQLEKRDEIFFVREVE